MLKKSSIRQYIVLLTSAVLLVNACASPGSLTGGEKDITPPKILDAKPGNNTVHFHSKEIRLSFDEFVVLKDINNEFIISPPTYKKPEIKSLGKIIEVKFSQEDTLKANTTYHLAFGNGIADNNEGNILSNFSYIFSTGSYLDSMYLEGKVINSFTLQPEKGVIVGLYKNYYDSIVVKEKPYYVARTDSSGSFKFKHLQSEKYFLFALRDMNSNYLYDLPTEEIAFTEDEVVLQVMSKKEDTIRNVDSLSIADTLQITKKEDAIRYQLRLFSTPDEKQRITFSEFVNKNRHLLLVAKKPMVEPIFKIVSPVLQTKCYTEFSDKKDSLHIWFMDLPSDSLLVIEVKDAQQVVDTVRLKLEHIEKKEIALGRHPETLAIQPNFSTKHPYFQPLQLAFSAPLQTTDSLMAIQLIYGGDTIYPPFSFTDSNKRVLRIDFSVSDKADSTLKIQIIGGKFTDIYGLTNDSINFATTIEGSENYGNLFFNFTINEPKGQYIIQLLSEKDIVLQEKITNKSEKITFANLRPANYRIKIIEDANLNNHWDTGNYWQKKQAESIRFLFKMLTVKANWDLEEDFAWDKNKEKK